MNNNLNDPQTVEPKRQRAGHSSYRNLIRVSIIAVFVIAAILLITFSHFSKVLIAKPHERSNPTVTTPVQAITALGQVAFDPRAGFPGKDRLNIVVMGIDDNWTDQHALYTKNARTDTLFLLTLDLDNRKSAILSFPRDSYVPIAGTNYSDKINSAYATGGPERSEATIAKLTGVTPDYYVVLNINATKKLVDALGGVDVNVEHQMDYDDNWGQLHVHLLPGFQHLTGDQALSFIRYRHGNHGLAPEDGDPRRIYRQHVLVRAMIAKAKTLQSAIDSGTLVDSAMSCVNTDLSRTQIADLAHIFQGVKQDDVITAELDGTDARGANGAWLVMLDPAEVSAYINWLVNGNEYAVRAITPVEVKCNPGKTEEAAAVVNQLHSSGFSAAFAAGSVDLPGHPTRVVDTGVEDPAAAHEIADVLGLPAGSVVKNPAQPNRAGWTPPQKISIVLGTNPQTASNQLSQ
jgi:LCP family protein required for cell wall assembly